MKKFLTRLPIVLIWLLLFILPGLVFGEVGMLILVIILLIGMLGCVTYEMEKEYQRK